MDRIVGENRSSLELLNADYTYLTQRLVKFYQLDGQIKDVDDNATSIWSNCRTIAAPVCWAWRACWA